jgi:hypothetical protein
LTPARLVQETVIGARPDPLFAAIELHARLDAELTQVTNREPRLPAKGLHYAAWEA